MTNRGFSTVSGEYWVVRSIRVLYVENDNALRKFLGSMLAAAPEIELVGQFSSVREAIQSNTVERADVALIDFALEQNGANGIELGLTLRTINENIGIVIYSQFSVQPMISRVPEAMRDGWSFFEKTGEMTTQDYVSILNDAARGRGNWRETLKESNMAREQTASVFFSLTPRQRSIMSLSAQGRSPQDIATTMGISYSYVRKELSRIYAVLLPDADPAVDLKTLAILRFIEVTAGL